MNFIEQCVAGTAKSSDVDDFIHEWHDGDTNCLLHEYLGMAWDEYVEWIEATKTLNQIIASRCRKARN